MSVFEELLHELRQRGERLTIQRRLVLEALCAEPGHHTVNQLRQMIEQSGESLDESTIYRIVQRLNELGLVSQTDLGWQGVVYELIRSTPHHHLVCLGCGAVISLEDSLAEGLRQSILEQYGFEARVEHLALFGWCRECQAARNTQHSADLKTAPLPFDSPKDNPCPSS
ncbi:MAG: Fur family transcriptional regulator [Aggregatilineales bacterium]